LVSRSHCGHNESHPATIRHCSEIFLAANCLITLFAYESQHNRFFNGLLGGAYVNFMMDEGVDRIKATYRDNYARLVEIKREYDPDNFFHVNQNIRPN